MLFWIKLLIFLPVNKSYYVRVNFHLWCWLVVMHRSMFLNLPNHISLRIVSAAVGFKIPISIQIQPMLFCFITNVLVHFKQYIKDGIVGSSMIEQPNSNNSFGILEVPVTTIIRNSCICQLHIHVLLNHANLQDAFQICKSNLCYLFILDLHCVTRVFLTA